MSQANFRIAPLAHLERQPELAGPSPAGAPDPPSGAPPVRWRRLRGAQVNGPIKNVRDAAEELRAVWEIHLDDINPNDLADRHQRWGKQRWGGPEYNWRALGDYADPAHRQHWDQMAVSAELRKLAQHRWKLFRAFFAAGSSMHDWIAALPLGSRLDVTWTPLAGAGFIPHVPCPKAMSQPRQFAAAWVIDRLLKIRTHKKT